jgi:hypothetical protein
VWGSKGGAIVICHLSFVICRFEEFHIPKNGGQKNAVVIFRLNTDDLEDVLTAVVKGATIEFRTTPAVCCYISDLK